jgi:hypothetical protein
LIGWIAENGLSFGAWTQNDAPSTQQLINVTMYNATLGANVTHTELVTVDNSINMPSAFSNFYNIASVKVRLSV